MKIRLTLSILYFLFLNSQHIHSFFDKSQEDDLIEHMKAIEKISQKFFDNFHAKIFSEFDKIESHLTNQTKKFDLDQNNSTFYQESSSFLSFANKEKRFEIQEQKNQDDNRVYKITVTDFMQDPVKKSNAKDINHVDELKEILNYITKNFKATHAQAIIASCIKLIEEPSDRLFTIETSTNGNIKKYIIKIAPEKSKQHPDNKTQETETVNDEDEDENEKYNKNKRYKIRSKKLKP